MTPRESMNPFESYATVQQVNEVIRKINHSVAVQMAFLKVISDSGLTTPKKFDDLVAVAESECDQLVSKLNEEYARNYGTHAYDSSTTP